MLAIGLPAAAHKQVLLIAGAMVGGVLADPLRARLRPSAERRRALRAFAFLVPAVLFGVYFLTLGVTDGLSWSIRLWTGAILQAGVVGMLLSFLLVPLPFTAGAAREEPCGESAAGTNSLVADLATSTGSGTHL